MLKLKKNAINAETEHVCTHYLQSLSLTLQQQQKQQQQLAKHSSRAAEARNVV